MATALAGMALVLASPANATPSPAQQAKIRAAEQTAEAAEQIGPRDIALRDQATLHLPAGEAFIPQGPANDLMEALGNSRNPDRMGLIVPHGDKGRWLVEMTWVHDGYVRDGDAKEWKSDALLDNLRKGTEAQNAERLSRGLPALDITGWVEQPSYDATTHRLIWSLAARVRGAPDDQPQNINYNTYALGREGYFSLDLISNTAAIDADKPIAHDLLAALRYAPGKRYEDFNGSTDKVAAYGLAGQLGLVLALGGWAAIKRFFAKLFGREANPLLGQRGDTDAPPPAAPPPTAP